MNAVSFNDINDSSRNSNNGAVSGFPAVTGYDLATGLGSPQCGLIGALVGGPSLNGGGGSGGNKAVNISATATQTGPDVCVTGSGFTPNNHVSGKYFGIPGRVAPFAGRSSTVKSDGSFDLGIDTGTEGLLKNLCTAAELSGTVVITVTEFDSNANVTGTANGTMPPQLFCATTAVGTNFNGGCK